MTYIPTQDDIKVQKALIGEFIIGFEQICAYIRLNILKICFPNYTQLENNNMETLLEGLTSDPLRKKLESLIFDNYSYDSAFLKLNKKLSDKFNLLIPIRNSIAHGTLLLGYKSFSGELSSDSFLLKHSKTTSKGIDRNSMIVNLSMLEKLIIQCNLITDCYTIVWVLLDKHITDSNKENYLNHLEESIAKIGLIKFEFENKVIK
jgi:hypothetical protein